MRTQLPGIRSDLAQMPAYSSPQPEARFRLNTNESPYAPPPSVLDEVGDVLAETALNRYPDKDAVELHKALSERLGWDDRGLWVANGSNEVLLQLLLAYGGAGRKAVTFEPTYSLHSTVARISGATVIPLERDRDFEIDLDKAIPVIRSEAPEIVFVCSPNNPSGGCEPLTSIQALCEESHALVIVDEAYIDFASLGDSADSLLNDYRNLVIVRTFSKAWRLAGIRVGYLMADPEVVEGLRAVRLPYHLSTVVQAFARVALSHFDELMKTVAAVVEERDRISFELQSLGLTTYPSRANFVLFEAGDPKSMWASLLDRDVLVRNYSQAHPRLSSTLRVTAGTAEESSAFIDAMQDILSSDDDA